MRLLVLSYTAATLCSALVVPDQEALLGTFTEGSFHKELVESAELIDNHAEGQIKSEICLLGDYSATISGPVRDSVVLSALGLFRPDGSARDGVVFRYGDLEWDSSIYYLLGDGDPYPGSGLYPGPHHPHHPHPYPHHPGYPHTHPGHPGSPCHPGQPKHPDPPSPPNPPGRQPPPGGNHPGEPCNPFPPGPPGHGGRPPPPPGTPPGQPCDPFPPGPPDGQPPYPGDPGTDPGRPPSGPGEPCNPPAPSNHTIWEMISQSPRTARLAKLLRKQDELVKILSSTSANYTFFAPTDHALDHLGNMVDLPSMESILRYHVVLGLHPSHRLRAFEHQTLSTILQESALGNRKNLKGDNKDKKKKDDKDKHKHGHDEYPQRLRVDAVQQSVLLNGVSEVISENIMAKNGIIHYIDLPLTPPPSTSTLLRLLPEEFSTFTLALSHAKLESHFEAAERHGGTTFVPTNEAFRTMGPVVNAYLFSPQGEECLRSILSYHILPGKTVYSDVVYSHDEDMDEFSVGDTHPKIRPRRYPVVRVDAETLFEGHEMSLHLRRRETVSNVKVNGFWEPRVVDVLAEDGVVHVLDRVLLPPRVAGKMTGKCGNVESMGTLRDLLEECRQKTQFRMEL